MMAADVSAPDFLRPLLLTSCAEARLLSSLDEKPAKNIRTQKNKPRGKKAWLLAVVWVGDVVIVVVVVGLALLVLGRLLLLLLRLQRADAARATGSLSGSGGLGGLGGPGGLGRLGGLSGLGGPGGGGGGGPVAVALGLLEVHAVPGQPLGLSRLARLASTPAAGGVLAERAVDRVERATVLLHRPGRRVPDEPLQELDVGELVPSSSRGGDWAGVSPVGGGGRLFHTMISNEEIYTCLAQMRRKDGEKNGECSAVRKGRER